MFFKPILLTSLTVGAFKIYASIFFGGYCQVSQPRIQCALIPHLSGADNVLETDLYPVAIITSALGI